MKRLVKLAAITAAFALPTMASAQDKVEATVGADIVSHYVWRGQNMAHASVQPTLGVAWKGLSLTAWGDYSFMESTDNKELDFTLAYSTGGFTIGITDYWVGSLSDKFYKYGSDDCHVFEANVGYDFGILSINWYTNFAGNVGYTKTGKKSYGSYFELAAPFRLGGLDWNAALGFVPFATSCYDADKGGVGAFALTNVSLKATKELKITDSFSLPLYANVIANPHAGKCYFVLGASIGL